MKLISSMAFAGLVALSEQATAADVYLKKSDFLSLPIDLKLGDTQNTVQTPSTAINRDMQFSPINSINEEKTSAVIKNKT